MTGFPWRGCAAGTIGVVCPDSGRAHDAWIADALGGLAGRSGRRIGRGAGLGGRAGRSGRRIGHGRPGQLGHRWAGRGAATEGGSGQQRAERPRQRAAARPGPYLADDPQPTEGDPYRQRPTRTDSAGVGTGAGRRLGDVQRSRKSLFSGEGLGRGRRDCGPYRRFSAGGFGECRDNPWAGAGFRGGEARRCSEAPEKGLASRRAGAGVVTVSVAAACASVFSAPAFARAGVGPGGWGQGRAGGPPRPRVAEAAAQTAAGRTPA